MSGQVAGDGQPSLQFLPRRRIFCCDDATRFAEWIERLFVALNQLPRPTIGQVNVAQLALQQQWWDERRDAPKLHKDRYKDRQDKLCLYGLYVESFARLRDIALSLDPPSLTLPPNPRRESPDESSRTLPLQALGLFYEDE